MNSKDILSKAPIIPVITIDNVKDAVPLAKALVEGGLPVLEITLRTKVGLDAIANIADEVPEAIVGAGTVLNVNDVKSVIAANSQFFITPGLTDSILRAAKDNYIPFLPGISTVHDIMLGLEYDINVFKFFPAEASGGVDALKAFAGPFPDVYFCPTGGINLDNLADYLSLKTVLSAGGSWVVPKQLVDAKDWDSIYELAEQAVMMVKKIEFSIALRRH